MMNSPRNKEIKKLASLEMKAVSRGQRKIDEKPQRMVNNNKKYGGIMLE